MAISDQMPVPKLLVSEPAPLPSTLSNQSIDRGSKVPIYEQVYTILRDRIRSGFYQNRRFPSTKQACEEFGISRISVKSAFTRLHQEALIVMSRGRETRICSSAEDVKVCSDIGSFFADLERLELATTVRVVRHEKCVPSSEVAAVLGCDPKQEIEKTTRLRSVDGAPFSIVEICVPDPYAKRFAARSFHKPISARLMRGYGIELRYVDERISACIADLNISKALRVPIGAAVLRILRAYLSTDHTPVICTIGYYRSDRYEHEARRGVEAHWELA